jgi:hypothetical protein
LNNSVIKNVSPDIVILKGRPYIGKDISSGMKPHVVVISPEVARGSQFYRMVKAIKADSVHSVREQGAFFIRL